MGKTYRRQPLSLFDDVQPVKTRIKSKMPKLIRRDGSKEYCGTCDQAGDYILNGTIVCKACGDKKLELWNNIIKEDA